jgi:hypothetical protein
LKAAMAAHPESLCVKYVYASVVLQEGSRQIDLLGRNGMIYGTPVHLATYSPESLLRIAQSITNDDKARELFVQVLKPLAEGNGSTIPLTCALLRELSKSEMCLKGFNWSIRDVRSSRSSSGFCPNSQAGCTERMLLLHWLPYAVSLFDEFPEQFDHLVVHEMHFYDKDKPPVIRASYNGQMIDHFEAKKERHTSGLLNYRDFRLLFKRLPV